MDNGQPINSYRDLRVWQEAMELAEICYRLTCSLPKEEMFGSSSQIRRSSASVPANIAEGHGREQTRSFIQHLRIASRIAKRIGDTSVACATRWIDREEANGSCNGKVRDSRKKASLADPFASAKGCA